MVEYLFGLVVGNSGDLDGVILRFEGREGIMLLENLKDYKTLFITKKFSLGFEPAKMH